MAWRQCLSGCGALVPDGSYCAFCRPARPNRNTGTWRRVRAAILIRDEFLCRIRGPRCTVAATCVDHIIPKARGGTDHPSNLQAACAPCNAEKGARMR